MSAQEQLQAMRAKAAEFRQSQKEYSTYAFHADTTQARQSYEQMASDYGDKAVNLETQVLAAITAQPVPVCPSCFDCDDRDEHEVVGQEGGAMMVECACGQTYLAQSEPVTVWTTRKYAPEDARAKQAEKDAKRPQGIPW